jgi:uncharacterized membrane protein
MFTMPNGLGRKIALILLSFFFVFAGVMHFLNAEFFVDIMPPYLPLHLELVYLSGVVEIALGLAVLPVATRSGAGLALIGLLVAIFPANIHMAVNPESYLEGGATMGFLYGRLPVQFVFMYWAWWATRPDAEPTPL